MTHPPETGDPDFPADRIGVVMEGWFIGHDQMVCLTGDGQTGQLRVCGLRRHRPRNGHEPQQISAITCGWGPFRDPQGRGQFTQTAVLFESFIASPGSLSKAIAIAENCELQTLYVRISTT